MPLKTPWEPIFMAGTARAFAWQVHGWGWGLITFLLMIVAVPTAMTALFYRRIQSGADPVSAATSGRRWRWIVWVIMMVGISILGMQIGGTSA